MDCIYLDGERYRTQVKVRTNYYEPSKDKKSKLCKTEKFPQCIRIKAYLSYLEQDKK